MTTGSIAIRRSGAVVVELFRRQATLTRYALLLVALAVAGLVAQAVDGRTIDGVGVWVKPVKFLVSIAIFALTAAWFFGYVRPERRRAPPLRGAVAVLIVAGSFELAWISWQAAHGLASHFNRTTALFSIMYGMMGLGALALVATTLPLAWEIARRPAPGLRPDFVAAVVIGLLLCFGLGGGLGVYMSQQAGHAVGAVGGHVPLFGWNRRGGDLRIAHFLGIHAEQAIPLLGAMVGGLRPAWRWTALALGTTSYTLLTIAMFVEAVDGRALLPL